MPIDPFQILGLSEEVGEAEVRAAFRRSCLRHHPDRNPGDPRAAGRMREVLSAYRRALWLVRMGRGRNVSGPGPAVSAVIPYRYACRRCADSFPVQDACPRCGIELDDIWSPATWCRRRGDAWDLTVESYVRHLEHPSPMKERLSGLPRIPVWLVGMILVAYGAAAAYIGLQAVGGALCVYGGWLLTLELHRRIHPPLPAFMAVLRGR